MRYDSSSAPESTSRASTSDRLSPRVQATLRTTYVHQREIVAYSKLRVPRIGEPASGRPMILKDKLQMLMARHSLNGQKLARLSQVSDSEISRILKGKSRPGLDNAFRLAKSVGVSLDYLADDSLDTEPAKPGDVLSPDERKIVAIAQKLGTSEVLTLLENIRFLGYDVAMSRLIGGKPVIEIDRDKSDTRPVVSPVAATIAASPRT
jgi:transcriptional regulator with XRE-family HTH domain